MSSVIWKSLENIDNAIDTIASQIAEEKKLMEERNNLMKEQNRIMTEILHHLRTN